MKVRVDTKKAGQKTSVEVAVSNPSQETRVSVHIVGSIPRRKSSRVLAKTKKALRNKKKPLSGTTSWSISRCESSSNTSQETCMNPERDTERAATFDDIASVTSADTAAVAETHTVSDSQHATLVVPATEQHNYESYWSNVPAALSSAGFGDSGWTPFTPSLGSGSIASNYFETLERAAARSDAMHDAWKKMSESFLQAEQAATLNAIQHPLGDAGTSDLQNIWRRDTDADTMVSLMSDMSWMTPQTLAHCMSQGDGDDGVDGVDGLAQYLSENLGLDMAHERDRTPSVCPNWMDQLWVDDSRITAGALPCPVSTTRVVSPIDVEPFYHAGILAKNCDSPNMQEILETAFGPGALDSDYDGQENEASSGSYSETDADNLVDEEELLSMTPGPETRWVYPDSLEPFSESKFLAEWHAKHFTNYFEIEIAQRALTHEQLTLLQQEIGTGDLRVDAQDPYLVSREYFEKWLYRLRTMWYAVIRQNPELTVLAWVSLTQRFSKTRSAVCTALYSLYEVYEDDIDIFYPPITGFMAAAFEFEHGMVQTYVLRHNLSPKCSHVSVPCEDVIDTAMITELFQRALPVRVESESSQEVLVSKNL